MYNLTPGTPYRAYNGRAFIVDCLLTVGRNGPDCVAFRHSDGEMRFMSLPEFIGEVEIPFPKQEPDCIFPLFYRDFKGPYSDTVRVPFCTEITMEELRESWEI